MENIKNEKYIKNVLNGYLSLFCKQNNLKTSNFPIKFLGRKKRHDSMEYACYFTIGNVNSPAQVKKLKTKKKVFFRYYIRCIKFKNRPNEMLEVARWLPEYGNVENTSVIYRSDDKKRYKQKLEDVLNDIYKLYILYPLILNTLY